jgi:hypothetical protein
MTIIKQIDDPIKKEPFYKWCYGKFKLAGYIQDGQTTDIKTSTPRNKYQSSESSHI